MRRVFFAILLVSGGLIAFPRLLWASSTVDAPAPTQGLESIVLIGVAVILVVAKLGGEVFERLGQPGGMGELIAGLLVGNMPLVGFRGGAFLKRNDVIVAP